jgi:divalent metal cation (Fe/Co/Zn/Cd) transporter
VSARDSRRAALRLEYFTLGWNALEAFVAIVAGLAAGSVALIGFGVDSVVESLSAAFLVWSLRARGSGEIERRERRGTRLVAASFWILAAYVAFDASISLFRREPPAPSIPGVLLAIASLIVMPLLARAKRRAAAEIESRALAADSRQTDFCAWLSAILLVGLALNAAAAWWWADPVCALAMTPIIAVEGVRAWRGETRCECR